MSVEAISQALEVKLNALTPALATAWENLNYNPVAGTPYQAASVLFARPENPTMGDGFYRQRGYLQVSLRYPQNAGKAACLARAQLLRGWFPRGLSLTVGSVIAIVEETPEVGIGSIDGDRYVINVYVRFFANIGA